jgi:small-conductance mechanosensitive channel
VWSRRTRNRADDLLLALVRATKIWFLAAIALRAGGQMVVWPAAGSRTLHVLTIAAVVVQVAIWGNLIIKYLLDRHMRLGQAGDEHAEANPAVGAIGFVLRLVLWSFLLLLGLDNLGVDITALVAGLGVGGVAVALAVQNILGDLFASLSIVFDKPFEPGDFIIVGELLGTVERVGLKTTRVRSLHGEQIVISNTDLLSSRIRNYKRMEERRIVFAVGVTYDTPREKLAGIPGLIRGVIEELPEVRFDRAHFRAFGAFSLDFEIVYYVLNADYNRYMDLQQAINLGIVEAFAQEAIEFAFPTQTLHLQMPSPGARALTEVTL